MGILSVVLGIAGAFFGGPVGAAVGSAAGTYFEGGDTEDILLAGALSYAGGAIGGAGGGEFGSALGGTDELALIGSGYGGAELAGGAAAGGGFGGWGTDEAGNLGGSGEEFAGGFGGNAGSYSEFPGDTNSLNMLASNSSGLGDGGFDSPPAVGPNDPSGATSGANPQPGQSSFMDDMRKRLGIKSNNPWSTAANVGTGLYGMYQSQQARQLAERASQQQDPFAPYRPQYAQQLSELQANPGNVQKLPGYQAGLDAVRRKMASQGYLGSGNMMAALQEYGGNAYNAEAQRLSQLAGAQFAPSGGNTLLQGNQMANNLLGQSLAGFGYGMRGLEQQQGA